MNGTADGRSVRPELLDVAVVLVAISLAFLATQLPPAHPGRVVVTMSTLLLAPGYALTLAVFPARGGLADGSGFGVEAVERTSDRPAGLETVERAALSFGLSIIVLPLLAFCLAGFGFGFDTMTVLIAVTAFTVPVLGVGVIRRVRMPTGIRYGPALGDLRARAGDLTHHSTVDAALNLVLVLVTISAIASLGLALAMPQSGTSYTQVSLLTEDLSGELSAAGYPTDLTRNQTGEVVLSVTNHEEVPTDYTVVVQVQQLGPEETITNRAELDRFTVQSQPEGTTRVRHEFQLRHPGEDQRVTYLLYRGEAAREPTIESAYRHVYLWVDVRKTGSGTGTNAVDSGAVDGDARVPLPGKAILLGGGNPPAKANPLAGGSK